MTKAKRAVAFVAHGDGCLVVTGKSVRDAKHRAQALARLAPAYPKGTPRARTRRARRKRVEVAE